MFRGEGANNTQCGKRSTIKDYLIDILKTVQGITRILTDLSKGELRYVQKKKNCSKKVHLKSLKYQQFSSQYMYILQKCQQIQIQGSSVPVHLVNENQWKTIFSVLTGLNRLMFCIVNQSDPFSPQIPGLGKVGQIVMQ